MIAAMSYVTVPVIGMAPTEVAVRQWKRTYDLGKGVAPPFALLSAGSFAYLAYATRSFAARSNRYVVAAVLVTSIIPYTIAIMAPGANNRLTDLAAESEAGKRGEVKLSASQEEVRELFSKWKNMNYVRAALTGSAALIGGFATLAL
jgi:hypothetical protein